MDYNSNVYLAVSLTPNSIYLTQPISHPSFPSLSLQGNVGQLPDVKLLSVPKADWENAGEQILASLKADRDNIVRVDVQTLKARKKRGDEL